MGSKTCSCCEKTLPISSFWSNGNYTHAHCRNCNAINKRKYREKHIREVREQDRLRYYGNKEKRLLLVKKRYKDKKEEIDLKRKLYRQTEGGKLTVKTWRSKNKERTKQYNKKQMVKPESKIRRSISRRILYVLKNGKENRRLEEILGYPMDNFKKHLEKQFTDRMSWDNYGKWHIDHIIPVSAFNFNTIEDIDFKRCFSMENLQPLWAKDNISKKAKLREPFQPSLSFSGGVS